jgi:hypothetical protein
MMFSLWNHVSVGSFHEKAPSNQDLFPAALVKRSAVGEPDDVQTEVERGDPENRLDGFLTSA